MISKLMQINSAQEAIIRKQAAMIDELYILLAQSADVKQGYDGILYGIKDIADRTEELSR